MRTLSFTSARRSFILSFHVLGRDNDLDFALQPFSERFDNLHVFLPSFRGGRAQTPFVSMSTTPVNLAARGFSQFHMHPHQREMAPSCSGNSAGRDLFPVSRPASQLWCG